MTLEIFDTNGREVAEAPCLASARLAVRTLLHEEQDEALAIYDGERHLLTSWLENGFLCTDTGDTIRPYEGR